MHSTRASATALAATGCSGGELAAQSRRGRRHLGAFAHRRLLRRQGRLLWARAPQQHHAPSCEPRGLHALRGLRGLSDAYALFRAFCDLVKKKGSVDNGVFVYNISNPCSFR